MGDKANELGKNLRANKQKADTANKRTKAIIPQIERVRDIMDPVTAFEMEFVTKKEGHRVLLDLDCTPPPGGSCCDGCYCSACDYFIATGETRCLVTYAYVPGTVNVFINDEVYTDFTETSPTLGQVTVQAETGLQIHVCYIYQICDDLGESPYPLPGGGGSGGGGGGIPSEPWPGGPGYPGGGGGSPGAGGGPYPTPSGNVSVTTNNQTLEGLDINGHIIVTGTYLAPITGLTIRNCRIRNGTYGIYLQHVDGFNISNNLITDQDYSGILTTSAANGQILNNTIQRIGYSLTAAEIAANNNAYGIALSRNAVASFTTDPRSHDILVQGNVVEDVPLWHGLDTHAGERITFDNNTVRRVPRAAFITTEALDSPAIDIVLSNNRFYEGVQVSGGTNKQGVTLYKTQGIDILNNICSTTYDAPPMTLDYLGFSTGVVESGTTYADEPAPPALNSVTVSSVPALLTQLADNSIDEIVVANGTYTISGPGSLSSNSLWIGSLASGGRPFKERTRPVYVRAETIGGVTFDGGGTAYAGLSFEDGAHDQTWDGFNFANITVRDSGVIEVGGYTARRSPFNITVKNITILASCTGRASTASGTTLDHGVYVAHGLGTGPYNLLFENFRVYGEGNLASGFHMYHNSPGAPCGHHILVKNWYVTGTQQSLIIWDETIHDLTVDNYVNVGAKAFAVRYEPYGDHESGAHSTNIVIKNSSSTGPHFPGYPGGLEANSGTVGLTLINCDFN